MAAIITPGGGNVTLACTYTATIAKIVDTAGSAAEELYNRGFWTHSVPFADLTNQTKADILDAYVLDIIRDLATDHHIKSAGEAAQATAKVEAESKFL